MKRIFPIAGIFILLFLAVITISCYKKEEKKKGQGETAAHIAAPKSEQDASAVKEAKKALAAKVNGARITMHDLVREMNAIAPAELGEKKEITPGLQEKIQKKALDNLIFRELAVQEAKRTGIALKPGTAEGVIKRMKESLGGAKEYEAYLKNLGVTEAEFKDRIERMQLFELIAARQIYSGIQIDEARIKALYEKEKGQSECGPAPYEDMKESLRKRLVAEEGKKRMKAWAGRLRARAKVEIL